MAPALSLKTAADHLDRMAVGWTRQHHCGSCHSNYPFLMARPALKEFDSPATGEVRAFLEKRVAHWDDADAEAKPRWDAEVVSTAEALAIHDAVTTGTLHPLTRKALDRMWTLQKADGGWEWLKCGWPPLEHDDYYGAIVAALAAGHAPDGYARGQSARDGLRQASRLFPEDACPRPAPPDHAALGLHPPRWPDGPGAEGGSHPRGAGTPARRRRLVLAVPGDTGSGATGRPTIPPRPATATPPGWSSSCSARPACRPRTRDPARTRLAQGQPAGLGPLVHPIAQRRQGPLHHRRRDVLRRDGPAPMRAGKPAGGAKDGPVRASHPRRGRAIPVVIVYNKPEAPAKPIVPPSAAPSRPVNFGSGDLVLIAVFLHSGVW